MRYLLSTLILLLALTGCLKVQDVNCGSTVSAPKLVSPTITVNEGDTLVLSVLSPTSGNIYEWFNPYGSPVYGNPAYVPNISSSQAGPWGVITSKVNTICFSDTTHFTVNISIGLPNCGLANNTLVLNQVTEDFSYTGYTNDYDSYILNYTNQYGTLAIYFPSQPTTGVYDIYDNPSDLYTGECCIVYSQSYDDIYSASGSVYVQVTGSLITIAFCNIDMEDDYYGTSYYNVEGLFKN